MEKAILKLLGRKGYTPANLPQLLNQLRLRPDQEQELKDTLQDLMNRGLVVRSKKDCFIISSEADLVPGVLQMTRQGRGYLQPDETGVAEILVPERATGTALHGDRVLVRRDVRPTGLSKHPDDPTGTVVRILERKRTNFVGTLQQSRQFLYVIPDDPRMGHNIYVPPPKDVGRKANPGDKVVVELLQWESRQTNPEGEVIEVLGPPDEEGVDMLSVLRHYDLPLHFPKPVLAEANAIAKSRPDNQPSAEECEGRVDCRKHNVITIDPDDAKDFDDAICIQEQPKDRWKLWVHIADVSHYVRPGSPLDVEAKKRGNSTYLVDRVIPMLPEALSNELCSLKPNVDRLTKCAEFLLSAEGTVISTKFYSAVIRSRRRFTYKEAFAVLQKAPGDATEQMLHDANAMAQRIRRLRFKNGSLDLDFPENKIRLDDHGKVLRIERIENDISHQLIEEFMLLANEAVAAHLIRRNRPAIHRIHEPPKDKRLQDFREDVLSHRIPCGNLNHRPEVQKLLARLGNLPAGSALKIGFLRSLMRARYSVEPVGHYGLAKTHYAHFTSPIRRYADLVVHRVLFDKADTPLPVLRQISDHITDTERNSADAERDSKELKLYAYLNAQLESGELVPYKALVTDLRNFGFFVDVTGLGMSGAVPLSSIRGDFYVLDAPRNQIVGRNTRRVIKLGDEVTVQIYRIDAFKKQVDFQLVSEEPERRFGRDESRRKERGKSHQDRSGERQEQSSERQGPPRRGRDETRERQGPRRKGQDQPRERQDESRKGQDQRGERQGAPPERQEQQRPARSGQSDRGGRSGRGPSDGAAKNDRPQKKPRHRKQPSKRKPDGQ